MADNLVPAAAGAASTHGGEAIRAVDGPVATRYERHFGVFAAIGACHLGHYALGTPVAAATAAAIAAAAAAVATAVAIAVAIAAVGARGFLGCAAIGAAHRLAIAFLRVKILLTLGKGERRAAIAARQHFV